MKRLLSILLVTAMIFVLMPAAAFAEDSGTYSDAELARAVNLGIGAYMLNNPTVTFSQFLKMLDRTVELADPGKLDAWKNIPQLKTARNSKAAMTRADGMVAVLCAAEVLGGIYVGQNNIKYGQLWDKMGNWPGKAGQNYQPNDEIYKNDFLHGTPKVLFNPQDDYEDRWGDAWIYSFGRISMWSRNYIFDYDEKSNTMRAEEPLLYTEALLAALRLYDSGIQMSERWATAEDKAILDSFNVRKQAILNSETAVQVKGTKYYVSNKGNDKNDGKTPQTAWATIEKALTVKKYGDGVFFERGGIYRGTLITQPGVTYSAYGTGPKPIITTSPENGAGEEKWSLVPGTNNIWQFYKELKQCGSIVVNGDTVIQRTTPYWDGEKHLQVLDYTIVNNNHKIGGLFDFKTMLPNNTFFNDIRYPKGTNLAEPPMNITGKLYFRCDEGNPGKVYDSIEFSMNGSHPTTICVGIIDKDVVIDNLAFLYAANGVNCEYGPTVENSVIQNCEVGFTGGRVYGFSNSGFSAAKESRMVGRDGDGIMLMGHNVTARNNYVHDTWDHAFTIETMYGTWRDEEKKRAADPDFKFYYDFLIENNVVENCASLFLLTDWTLISTEYERPAMLNEYRDITIRNNYAINNGYHWRTRGNGGQQQTGRGGIGFAHPVGSGGITVENNVIYRTNTNSEFASVALFYYPEAEKPVFKGNTLVQDNYTPLVSQSFGTPDTDNAIIIYNNGVYNTKSVEQSVKEMLGDETARILPISEPPKLTKLSEIRKIGEKYMLSCTGVNSITKVAYEVVEGTDVASISPQGEVNAIKAGTAKIKLTFSNGINKDIVQIYTLNVIK
jgi:hypothetical protein